MNEQASYNRIEFMPPSAGMSFVEFTGEHQMATGLFNPTGVRYEVALDVLGAIISHYAAVIAAEEQKAQPDPAVIQQAEGEQQAIRDLRRSLDANDATAIEHIISTYGPQARALYQQ